MSYLCNVEKIRDTLDMRIFTEQVLKEYIAVRPEVKTALQEWVMIVKQSQWTCFADIKATFNSVDSIGNQRYVFNIKGNKYRLVVVIKFTIKSDPRPRPPRTRIPGWGTQPDDAAERDRQRDRKSVV